MQRFGMMARVIAVALGVVIAIAALSHASAQQEPPHRYYGTDATPGDTIGVHDADGTLLGEATVASDGSWYVDIDRDSANGMTFSVNGEAATAETDDTGAGQTEVSNLQVIPPPPTPEPDPCPDDSLEGDDSMMSEDSMEEDSMMSDDDDSMMSDDGDAMLDCPEEGDEDGDMMDDGDDSMMSDDDEAMLDDETGYPSTGSGGLADGGLSAGLIGLLIALGAATIAGIGYRRVRNRA